MSIVLAIALALGAQDDEKDLTPEEAMRLLHEAQGLMEKSEELLHDSSRGRALETEAELMKKLEKLLEEEPGALQKQILEKIQKMLRTTEKRQQETIGKLEEIIRRAKASESSSSSKSDQPEKGEKSQKPSKPNGGQQNATKPYDPGRTDPPSKFRSEADRTGAWGDLPARIRDAILHGSRDLDEYPAEYREMIKEYMESIINEKNK